MQKTMARQTKPAAQKIEVYYFDAKIGLSLLVFRVQAPHQLYDLRNKQTNKNPSNHMEYCQHFNQL